MNTAVRPAEDGHDQRVGGVHAGHFHGVRAFVRRDALEHQLADIGVLALVPLEWDVQQPYSQGFYSVAQLALYLQYGLYPSDMDTGGLGLVDASNVAFVKELTGTYR